MPFLITEVRVEVRVRVRVRVTSNIVPNRASYACKRSVQASQANSYHTFSLNPTKMFRCTRTDLTQVWDRRLDLPGTN